MLPILNQSFWRDEAFSALLSEKSPLQIIRLTTHDVQPPLYYLFLHYWMLIWGNNEVVLRSFSFLFYILIVLVVFLIARNLIKSKLGQVLIASAVFLNPFLLQYSFEARPYSLLAFLTVLALYFAITKRYLLTGIVLSIAILTHNFAIFAFISFVLWWIFTHKNNLQLKNFLNLAILPTVSVLAWGGVLWSQWVKVAQNFWINQSTSSIFIHSLEIYSKGDLSYPVQPMLYTFTLILLAFTFSYWVWKERKAENTSITLLLFVVFIPTLITYLISAFFAPIYHERYLIGTVPTLILLVGYSSYKLYESNSSLKTLLTVVIAIYAILLIQTSEQIIGTTTKPAINWGVSQILSKASDKDVIIPKSNLNFLETKYYVERSGKNIKVYAYSPDNKIPWYIGGILFEPKEIVTKIPDLKTAKVWQVNPDGGYELLK